LSTREAKLCDDPLVFWIINISKWFLFYGYLSVVVVSLATLVFLEGPVVVSPVSFFLGSLFTLFFPHIYLFSTPIYSLSEFERNGIINNDFIKFL
jgi:hypothetical protein